MSLEENKAVIRTFLDDLYNHGQAAQTEAVIVSPLLRGALIRVATLARSRLAGFHLEIVDLIAEGDLVVARCALRGTYTRRCLGLTLVNRFIDMGYLGGYRLEAGRVKAFWFFGDLAGLLKQLGPLGALCLLLESRTR